VAEPLLEGRSFASHDRAGLGAYASSRRQERVDDGCPRGERVGSMVKKFLHLRCRRFRAAKIMNHQCARPSPNAETRPSPTEPDPCAAAHPGVTNCRPRCMCSGDPDAPNGAYAPSLRRTSVVPNGKACCSRGPRFSKISQLRSPWPIHQLCIAARNRPGRTRPRT